MLNHAAAEALYSATYVEDYLDCVENMPDDLQRSLSQIRELDVRYQEILRELESHQESMKRESLDSMTRKKLLNHIQRSLIRTQEIGDEKLQIVQQILDLIENKSKQLEIDYKNLDFGKDQENAEPPKVDPQPERTSKRARRQRHDGGGAMGGSSVGGGTSGMSGASSREEAVHEKSEEKASGAATAATTTATTTTTATAGKKSKKKKRRTKATEKERDDSPLDPPIDPDEPTYCLCQQISYGEMIGCDNERCSIEWFHFSCVGLTTKPKGKWYCPKCRGDRPNVMKPRT